MAIIQKQRATLFLAKDKTRKDGCAPLYVRFKRVGTFEPKYSLKIYLPREEWDDAQKRAKNAATDALIQREKARIDLCLEQSFLAQQELGVDALERIAKGQEYQAPQPNNSFYHYWAEYTKTQSERGWLIASTMRGYNATLKALKDFKTEIKLADISLSLLQRFDSHLLTKAKKEGKSDIAEARRNHFKRISAVISYIQALGFRLPNPIKDKSLKLPKVEENKIYLTEDEVSRSVLLWIDGMEMGFALEGNLFFDTLSVFLFACFTGLRIGDAIALTWSNINRTDDENWVLQFNTQKTNQEVILAIPKIAHSILENGTFDPEPGEESTTFVFPLRNRNIINENLHGLSDYLETDKHITFHTARRTFATLLANKGISDYLISNALGHSARNTTAQYQKWTVELAKENRDKLSIIEL